MVRNIPIKDVFSCRIIAIILPLTNLVSLMKKPQKQPTILEKKPRNNEKKENILESKKQMKTRRKFKSYLDPILQNNDQNNCWQLVIL